MAGGAACDVGDADKAMTDGSASESDDEAKRVWQFLKEVNRLAAWEDGLYATSCGCVHRFLAHEELPSHCLAHQIDVEWVLIQKF